MEQGISKENQSSVDTAYRFANFELHPRERLLKRAGETLTLQPKAFDALLCLVRNAEHLVSKQELTDALWPSIHVSESNLTNIIVSLIKLIGRGAVRTVSKHGYRFALPVAGEPGVARATYERFARAKELTAQRSLHSMSLAREFTLSAPQKTPALQPPGPGWAGAAGFLANSAATPQRIWNWRTPRSVERLHSIRIWLALISSIPSCKLTQAGQTTPWFGCFKGSSVIPTNSSLSAVLSRCCASADC